MASAQEITTRRRVLVVDDERSVRDVLAEGLEMMGYEVAVASSPDEALEVVQKHPDIRLVLSDIDMPGGSGLDLLKGVKSFNPDVDVVMVTGVVDTDTAINTIRDGASDYVTKPFNLQEVGIVVERTLEKRQLILENRAYQQNLEEKVHERTAELLQKKAEIEKLFGELQDSYENTLHALVTALDFRDNETQGHSSRVVEYAVLVAGAMGIREPEMTWIRRGAILHDVGKIGIADAVLKKPGKLNEDEWVEMKKHPEMGYRMLQHIDFLKPALPIVLCHQERWDGTGYPQKLEEKAIPLGARIFAVVDTFDAMTSDRPYRPALPIEAAVEEIRRCAGTQFDPAVAEAFLSISPDKWREIRERVHREVTDLEEKVRRVWR